MSDLTFREVSDTNRKRCERWHPGFPNDGWTGADWSDAMQGEAGEAGNKVKKIRRIETGLLAAAGDTREQLLGELADEIGDTFAYLDLLAQFYGLDLAACVVDKFNRVSAREGFPERLPTGRPVSRVFCQICGHGPDALTAGSLQQVPGGPEASDGQIWVCSDAETCAGRNRVERVAA
jgi:NTP pyrophosphatase (non-canonical NTP hydrolase)